VELYNLLTIYIKISTTFTKDDMMESINAFEKTLQAIGKDPKTLGGENRVVHPSNSQLLSSTMPSKTGDKLLASMKPPQSVKPEQEVHEFMKRIKVSMIVTLYCIFTMITTITTEKERR
jgi:hypothetical protein